MQGINFKMKNFEPDYTKCADSRKIIYHNICKHNIKNNIMLCGINNKICIAWEEYRHEGE
jgi:hypothetical protein